MTTSRFSIAWHDSGHDPRCAPDPRYPSGKDVEVPSIGPRCKVELPYPAKRCGHYVVGCSSCGTSIAVTTAGRPDDPRSVTFPCRAKAAPEGLH